MKRITYKDYYTTALKPHSTGDIWKNLPTMGLLKRKQCTGIIITPACDLEQAKTETLNYLPLISIREYFASRSFYPHVYKKLITLSKTYQDPTIETLLGKNFLPTVTDLQELIDDYNAKLKVLAGNKKDQANTYQKIIDGLSWAKDISDGSKHEVTESVLKSVMSEKDFQKMKVEFVRNNFSTDLHFLPRDEQDPTWSAVTAHSVALFRYPITVPIEIMDLADTYYGASWQQKMTEKTSQFAIAKEFILSPLKVSRLNDAFLNDLLTRFAGLYIRIGSPDFDESSIKTLSTEI